MSRDLPNLGLKGGYLDGDENWGGEQNANLLKLSTLVQGGVSEIVAAEPGAPTPGQVVILDETNATNPNAVAVWEGPVGEEAWTYFTPDAGWLLWDNSQAAYVTFNGTTWAVLETGGGGGGGGAGAPAMVPFTGTGAEQTVDLGGPPATVMVFVGGLFNYPDEDYEISGEDLIITTNEAGAKGMAAVWYGEGPAAIESSQWRLYVTTNNGGVLTSVAELFLYTDNSPTDVATSGTPDQSGQYDAFDAGRFLDRNGSTFASLQLAGAGLPGWFRVTFTSPQAIIGFGLTGRASELNNTPKDMVLQYWDGSTWVDFLTPEAQTGWTSARRDFFA